MRPIYFTLLFFFLVGTSTSVLAQSCHPLDQAALERLRDLTNGTGGPGSWNTITNIPNGSIAQWLGPNVYQWHGIDTIHDPSSTAFYRIKKIDLDGTNFQGLQRLENELPDSLFLNDGLEFCDSIILRNNNMTGISGNLKPSASFPSALFYLNLSNNDFVPGDPNVFNYLLSNFSNLKIATFNSIMDGTGSALNSYLFPTLNSLQRLYLQNNKFTGTLDLFQLVNANFESMTDLLLSFNQLTAINITSNAALSSLEKLQIAENDIINFQDISNALEFLPNLTHLEGPSCMDESLGAPMIISATSFPTTLLQINLSNNGLIGTFPIQFFEGIPSIEGIEIQNNNLVGTLPEPQFIFTSTSFIGKPAYAGTANLKTIHIHSNNFQGSLHLDWFLLSQFAAHLSTSGQNMPLQQFNASGNDFQEIIPHLGESHISSIINTYSNRFANLDVLSLQENGFDFKDLFRAKKIFRLKQVSIGLNDHYVPQLGSTPNDFSYAPQDSVGIGGLKRRNSGDSVIIEVGRNVVEQEIGGPTHVLPNSYSWERVNLAGGFNTIGSVLPGGGFSGPGGPGYQPANGNLGNSLYQHTLGIKNLNGLFHHDQRFTACVDNDSFPNLTICLKQKKIEVGDCLDNSGRPIDCQKAVVHFDPVLLATMTPTEQDSFKAAEAASIGATPVAECVCGDLELWEISDTSTTMAEGFGKGTQNAATTLGSKPSLLSAEPNHLIADSSSTALPDTVALPIASGNTSSKTLVAIIDSGIDYEYPSLVPFISEGASLNSSCMQDAIWGYNFLDSTNNASDDHGHGTAIAGIVTGLSQQNLLPDTSSSVGAIGILPLKYTDKHGEGTVFHAACAMFYAADYARTTSNGATAKVRVINNSWGFYGDPSSVLNYTIEYAANDCDILIICSAGNDATPIEGADSLRHWPSNAPDYSTSPSYDNILTIGAINNHSSDTLASYSNYSATHVDLVAQGTDISTQGGSVNGFGTVNGTSFSTAQVSRAAALLFDKYPTATYWAVKFALMESVDILQSNDSSKIKTGGRLNYLRADSILNVLTDRTICADYNLVGVHNIELIDHQLLLYPNPVSDNLTIEVLEMTHDRSIEISLFNLQGQQLDYKELEVGAYQSQLSTKALPAGVYFVQINLGGKQITKKVIKQ